MVDAVSGVHARAWQRVGAVLVAVSLVGLSGCSLLRASDDSAGGSSSTTGAAGAAEDGQSQQVVVDRAAQDEMVRTWYSRLGDCLTELGFPASLEAGTLKVYTPPGSEGQYKEADQECHARVGPHPELVPYSKEEFGYLYDALVESEQCLREHGYRVGDVQMPTRETWVEWSLAAEHGAREAAPNPYGRVDSVAIEEVCPYPDGTDIERLRQSAQE